MRIFTNVEINVVQEELDEVSVRDTISSNLAAKASCAISFLRQRVRELLTINNEREQILKGRATTIRQLRHAVVDAGKLGEDKRGVLEHENIILHRVFEERGRIIKGYRDALETAKDQFWSFYLHHLGRTRPDPRVCVEEIEKVLKADLTHYPNDSEQIRMDEASEIPPKMWDYVPEAVSAPPLDQPIKDEHDRDFWMRAAIREVVRGTKREKELTDIIIDLTNKNEDLAFLAYQEKHS